MRLFDGRFAPVTDAIGFVPGRADDVAHLIRDTLRVAPSSIAIDEPLEVALRRLDPLDHGAGRRLVVGTTSGWTAIFDNSVEHPSLEFGSLVDRMPCQVELAGGRRASGG